MAIQMFSIPQFFGMKFGIADNLVPLGYASEAKNVDLTDGALQTLIGLVPFPDVIDSGTLLRPLPEYLWEAGSADWYCVDPYTQKLLRIHYKTDGLHCEVAYTPTLSEAALLSNVRFPFLVEINGERVALLGSASHTPAVIGYTDPNNYYVRPFGSGMFLTNDAITSVTTDANSAITGVVIGRAMTDDEVARCVYAGVYITETEQEELDLTAAYVSECQVSSNSTTIVFKDTLPAGSVTAGYYVKVRGGLSDMPVTEYAVFYGRLFSAGNPSFPNRLYWSCLPGDGRTIEDWTADDASADTGGGYMQVGSDGSAITALFVFDQQLLIWCGEDLWRLYGATPSQYTLERVFTGFRATSSDMTSVNGVLYVMSDDGLWYYNGSALLRADSDHTLASFIRERYGEKVGNYEAALNTELNSAYDLDIYDGGLFFTLLPRDRRDFVWVDLENMDYRGAYQLGRYDLATGSLIMLDVPPAKRAFRRGLLCGLGTERGRVLPPDSHGFGLLLYGMNMCEADVLKTFSTLPGSWPPVYVEDTPTWEELYHKIPDAGYPSGYYAIDASWESYDLSFGSVSYHKRLRRIGLDVTGPVRVIVKTPEGVVIRKDLTVTDLRARRFEWLLLDMPYECTFRIRFESIDGKPFRIHNGVDFYIETNQRN